MEFGTSFLKSKIAKRFCLVFLSCAFIPTVILMVFSYNKVANQIEDQSLIRLKREVKAYSLTLFDRLLRVNIDLHNIARNIVINQRIGESLPLYDAEDVSGQLSGVISYSEGSPAVTVFGGIEFKDIENLLTPELLTAERPFILVGPGAAHDHKIYMGVNIHNSGKNNLMVLGEIRLAYLWGTGLEPILPPMTELLVYDSEGGLIVSTIPSTPENISGFNNRTRSKDLKVFEYEIDGDTYLASRSNLFLKSNFEKSVWTVIFSQKRSEVMSSLETFKRTFPFIVLFFLLLILYLSINFIRRSLIPLEILKEGAKRIGNKDFKTAVEINSNDEFQDLGTTFNDMADNLDKQFNTLSLLGEIDRAILSSLDKDEILLTTMQRIRDFFSSEVSMFVKYSKSSKGHVRVWKYSGKRKSDITSEYHSLMPGEHELLFRDIPSFTLSKDHDWLALLERVHFERVTIYICFPLSVGGDTDSLLLLGWEKNDIPLKEDEIDQARQVSNQLAVALSNARLMSDMQNFAMGTIEALARTVDAKSKWTAGHSERVAELSSRVAKVMGLSSSQVESLVRGGLLHDIGKIGIPSSILDKPGKLSEEEYVEVKTHPEIGAKILQPIEAYQDIIPIIRQHHEKFDGTGYPDGLQGEEIDLRSRIMGVADVWDAVVSDRPYREGWIHEKAKKLIIDGAGTHFDPAVVESFLTVISDA